MAGFILRKHSLLKTNILVCTIILIGFFITAIVSYRSNIGVFEKDVEHVSTLATEASIPKSNRFSHVPSAFH